MRRLSNVLLVACFLAAISAPLAVNIAGYDGADAAAENRTLASWPALDRTMHSLGRFGPRFGHWFEDHFGLRARLIRWYGITRYFWLGVTPAPTVAIGHDGWLFYMADGGLEDYTNERPLSSEELAEWRRMVTRASAWCRARGIAYLLVIAPDKHATYPEQFPHTIRKLSPVSRTDQVVTATADIGTVLDLRPALLARRGVERLFHRTDTHWNARGAFYGYEAIIDALRMRVPALPPAKRREDFEGSVRTAPGMDLAGMIGLTRVLEEEDLVLEPKALPKSIVRVQSGGAVVGGEPIMITEIPDSTLPRAVVFRDSFGASLAPFLSEHFSRVVYVRQDGFDAALVEQEKPDVVLHQIVGRHLHTVEPNSALIPDP